MATAIYTQRNLPVRDRMAADAQEPIHTASRTIRLLLQTLTRPPYFDQLNEPLRVDEILEIGEKCGLKIEFPSPASAQSTICRLSDQDFNAFLNSRPLDKFWDPRTALSNITNEFQTLYHAGYQFSQTSYELHEQGQWRTEEHMSLQKFTSRLSTGRM